MTATLAQPYQYLPQPSDPDYDRLKESIREAGGLWPGHEIEVDEGGTILDGYTRERVCAELGLPCPRRVRTDLKTEDEKFDYIIKINLARRHLTIEQKRDLTREYLRRFPHKSDRSIASTLGMSDKTVGAVRHGEEVSAEIPQTVRPHQRSDQEREDFPQYAGGNGTQAEPVYRPDHLNSAVVTILVNYPMQSEDERTRKGLPHPTTAKRKEWECELVMASTTPDSAISLEPFAAEAFERFKREVRARPFLTMRR